MKNRYILCMGFVLLVCGQCIFAQEEEIVTTEQASNTDADLTASSVDASRNIMLARSSADYRVTPGDVYTLAYAVGSNSVSYVIAVDTSYRIRVSNLGIVNGAGKTFVQLKSEVETIITNNYPLSGVQLVLTQPSVFRVYVNGEVNRAGEISAWGLSRLSSLVNRNLTAYASTRDISVKSSNGQVRVYDLFKAQRFGDMSQDPYLRPGDVVTFNRLSRLVTINGEVERPGRYQIMEGENLEALIGVYAKGFTPLVDKTRITLTRYVGSVEISGDITYLTEDDLVGNYVLRHLDVISVPRITTLRPPVYVTRMERRITITGAVRRPGTYDLLPDEHLMDLIEAYANGLTPLADPTRIEVIRLINSVHVASDKIFLSENDVKSNFPLENFDNVYVPSITQLMPVMFVEGALRTGTEESVDLASTTRLTVQFNAGDTYASLVRRNARWFTPVSDTQNAYILRRNERIPVNLNPMLYNATYRDELFLEDEDILIVPFRQYFISVAGAVYLPGRYPYIPDRDWEYYVGLAGGFVSGRNTGNSVTITDVNGKRLKKTDAIAPETTITANTNHALYYFNQYAPVFTTILSVVTTALSIWAITSR